MSPRTTAALLALLALLGCEERAATPAPSAAAPPPAPVASASATRDAPAPSGVSPVVSQAPARFVGTFVGDRLRLTLRGEGARRSGTLRIRKRSFPLAARIADDALQGTFQVGARRLPLTVRADADALVLTCDGRSYRLVAPAEVDPWSGRFHADDGRSSLVLERADGDALRGRIEADGLRYALAGTVAGDGVRGTLTDPQTGEGQGFRATRAGERLTFVLRTVEAGQTSLRTLIFERD